MTALSPQAAPDERALDNDLAPYRIFTREQWAKLRAT